MTRDAADIVSKGERLRRAVAWLSDVRRHDAAAVEEAARRFDLSPLQEEFLLRYFRSAPDDGADD